jgi:stearoyl-CoA desaturase (delta-9 desaturase)
MTRFFQRTFWIWVALSFAIPFALGGWTGLLWGGWVRVFLSHHITFSVNSICHTFGRSPYDTGDRSRNQWLVGLLAFGEGWHNNHHAFPRSAFHGLRWWQIDLSAYLIVALERLGLVWNVHRVAPAAREARRARSAPAS